MIEILFGESEAGSMKAAKNKIVIGAVNGPTSVWMAGKKTPPERPFTGWVEGTAEEVICLGFMMDVGNIKEPMDSLYRKELIYSLYAWNQWEQDAETKEARLIGDILGSYQMSVGDWWYAKRIEYYIRQGKIRVVEDSEYRYARLICADGEAGK